MWLRGQWLEQFKDDLNLHKDPGESCRGGIIQLGIESTPNSAHSSSTGKRGVWSAMLPLLPTLNIIKFG